MVRNATLEAHLPFLNIVQACTWARAAMRVPGPDEERFLVYTTLAYGGQAISYFVYYSPDMTGGIATADNKPTRLYYALKPLNREFVAIAKELQPMRSLAVYHAGMSPPGSTPLPAKAAFRFDPPIAPIAYKPPERVRGFLLGYFGWATSQATWWSSTWITSPRRRLIWSGRASWRRLTRSPTSGARPARLELRLPPGGGKLVRVAGASDDRSK